jgi:hypothetical protein
MMVMLGGRQNTNDDEEELEVDSTYHGEEEEMEGGDDNENGSDDGQKPKEISTPLWNYVRRRGGEKRGGTTKFICPHCHKNLHGFLYLCEKASLWGYAIG